MISRAVKDLIGAWSVMPIGQAIRWETNAFIHIAEIIQSRKFEPADRKMRGIVQFHYRGLVFEYDLDAASPGTFTWLREFFVREAYFWAFDIEHLKLDCCLDLGCNQGRVAEIFSIMGGGQNFILAIDADDYSENTVRRDIAQRHSVKFLRRFVCTPKESEGFNRTKYLQGIKDINLNCLPISGHEIIEMFNGRRIDFVKMDIEGAEFDLIFNDNRWLASVDNLAMEVHKDIGDPASIIRKLNLMGFATAWKGNHQDSVLASNADFIYASRTNLIKRRMNYHEMADAACHALS